MQRAALTSGPGSAVGSAVSADSARDPPPGSESPRPPPWLEALGRRDRNPEERWPGRVEETCRGGGYRPRANGGGAAGDRRPGQDPAPDGACELIKAGLVRAPFTGPTT